MICLSEEMRRAINRARDDGFPCIMATASPEGVPDAGFRGTMVVFNDQALAYRERGGLAKIEQLAKSPRVIILYRNPDLDLGWKFRCTASVHHDGPVYRKLMNLLVEEGVLARDDGTGAAVFLQVDQVLGLYGEVLQERVPNLRW